MADSFDVVVLGGGSGGYYAALRLARLGRSVAVVERDKLGGTCLHRGCIPTKIFLESAGFYDRVRHAADLGVSVGGEVGIDFGAVAIRKNRIVAANEQGIKALFRGSGVTSVPGEGRLDGRGAVAVKGADGERRLQARDVLIATGSRPKSLPGLEVDGERVVTSDHVTQWTTLPRSIVVIGAGAVGAEFASAMSDFGVETTLVEFLPRVLPLEDAEVGQVVARSFGKRGIKVLTGARVLPETLQRDRDGVSVEVEVGGQRQRVGGERMLVATGREPITAGIGLESAGVQVERGFVKVDGRMRTTAEHVYAVGDVVGGLMLAHVAFGEGEVAARTIAGQSVPPIDYNLMPRATYTRPEVASVGLTEEQAGQNGRQVKVGRFGFAANPRAMIHGEAEGLTKVVADAATGEILGVHMVGPHVTELIAEATVAKLLESTTHEVHATVHAHPTLSEIVAEAMADVDGEAVHQHRAARR